MEITNCQLIGVKTSSWAMPPTKTIATLADIKKVIQPMLSKWAALADLAIQREKFKNGDPHQPYQPRKGRKNWVSLRSDKKLHTFEIGTQDPNKEDAHNTALKAYAIFLEKFIELNYNQKVPVTIGCIASYGTVTSGESSSTVFRGEELAEDPEEWF
jgi:hypothetical protein